MPGKSLDTHSSELEGMSKLLTGTVHSGGLFIRSTCAIYFNPIQQLCFKCYIYEVYTFSVCVDVVRKVIILLYVYYWGHSGWWWCIKLNSVPNILSTPLKLLLPFLHFTQHFERQQPLLPPMSHPRTPFPSANVHHIYIVFFFPMGAAGGGSRGSLLSVIVSRYCLFMAIMDVL